MSSEEMAAVEEASAEEQEAYLAEMAADTDAQAPDTEQAVTEETETPAPEAVAPERVEVVPGYTVEELNAKFAQVDALQRALDTTNGTYGARLAEQQRILNELAQHRQSGGTLSVTQLKNLSAAYPEIAEMLAADLAGVVSQGGNAPSFDPNQVIAAAKQQALAEVKAVERNMELKALNRAHRDWQQVAAFEPMPNGSIQWRNPQFGQWVARQPVEVQRQIVMSEDADFLSEKLTEFKAALKPKAVKQQQLAAAVMPRGLGGRASPNDLEDEDAAYRAEMARM